MSSSAMKRMRMQSASWYLGTPGITVTCLRLLSEDLVPLAPASLAFAPSGAASVRGAGPGFPAVPGVPGWAVSARGAVPAAAVAFAAVAFAAVAFAAVAF